MSRDEPHASSYDLGEECSEQIELVNALCGKYPNLWVLPLDRQRLLMHTVIRHKQCNTEAMIRSTLMWHIEAQNFFSDFVFLLAAHSPLLRLSVLRSTHEPNVWTSL